MDFKKTLTVEVNQKGVSATANALGKLAQNASALDKPIVQAKQALNSLSKVSLDSTVTSLRSVSTEVNTFHKNVAGLGELASGMKGISGSFTSIATAAERLVSSTSGLDSFNAKLQAIRDTLQSMQGLSGTLTGISKVPSGVTIRGGGGGGSEANPDKALATSQKRFLNDLTRQTIVTTEGKAAYLEYKAAQLGVTQQSAAMIEKLKGSQQELGKTGMSARATAQAMRMVPAQFTDIVTQLAGGQSPFLIMIQQGGQLRDMFQGFGPMFKNVGGLVLKWLANPFVLATAAVSALGAAFIYGRAESEAFGKATALTGNYIGISTDRFTALTEETAKLAGGQNRAAEAMTALASTGKITGDNIEKLTTSTANFARVSGMDIEKVAQQYASLKDKPAESLLKLNESYHFLTQATYEQIKALEKEGNLLAATKVAQDALAQAQDSMTANLVKNAGYVERAWTSVKDVFNGVLNSILSIGRQSSVTQQIASATAELQKMEAERARRQATGGNLLPEEQAKLAALQRQVNAQNALNGRNEASIKMAAARQQAEEKAIEATTRLSSLEQKGTEKVKLKAQAYKQLEKDLAALRDVNPNSASLSKESIAAQRAAIEKEFGDKGGVKSSDSRIASLKAELDALEQNRIGLQTYGNEYNNVTENAKRLLAVQELLATGKGTKEQVAALKEEQKLLQGITQLELINSNIKKQNDEVKKQKEVAASIDATSLALQDQLQYLKESGAISDTRTKIEKDLAQAKIDASNESLSVAARNEAALNSIALERLNTEDRAVKMQMETNKVSQQYAKTQLENSNALSTLAESQQKELEWMGMSNKEKEKAQALWAIEVASRKEIVALEAQKQAAAGNTDAIAILDSQIQKTKDNAASQMSMVQAFQKTKESGLSFYGDLSVAAKNWYDSLPTQQQEMSSVFSSTYSQMSDVMTNFVTTGKANWKDFTKSVLTNISQILVKIAILRMAQMVAGVASPNSSTPSADQTAAFNTHGSMGGTASAHGNAFVTRAFAQGGVLSNTVVTKPTYFAAGGVPGINVMGERAGSVGEAVMPLVRNSKGDLSVNAVGQGGGGTQVNIEINVASDGSATTTTSGTTQQDAMQLAKAMEAAALKVIVEQKRKGGMLA